jgi:hypothetical protein
MAKKLDPKETVTLEDLLIHNTYEQEALVNLLERKGIIPKEELLAEMKRLKNQKPA